MDEGWTTVKKKKGKSTRVDLTPALASLSLAPSPSSPPPAAQVVEPAALQPVKGRIPSPSSVSAAAPPFKPASERHEGQRQPRALGQGLQNGGRLLWVDCEVRSLLLECSYDLDEPQMTGLNLQSDVLIEVAALVTDRQLNLLDEGISLVIRTPKAKLDGMVRLAPACV